jgi:hypothetical protein
MGWVVNATLRPLHSREKPGTYCIGGWVGPRAGLDGCGKSCPHRDSIPGPSSPYRVAILSELSRPRRKAVTLRFSVWTSNYIEYWCQMVSLEVVARRRAPQEKFTLLELLCPETNARKFSPNDAAQQPRRLQPSPIPL